MNSRAAAACPRILWLNWFQGEQDMRRTYRNSTVHGVAVQQWRKLNPGWQINIVTDQNLRYFLPRMPEQLRYLRARKVSYTHQSDFLRLHLLHEFGGVWSDISVVPLVPLETMLLHMLRDGSPFFAYRFNPRCGDKDIASWFLVASAPRLPLINKWRRLFALRACIFGCRLQEIHRALSDLYDRDKDVREQIDNMVQLSVRVPHAFSRKHVTASSLRCHRALHRMAFMLKRPRSITGLLE
jgi:hypothetical protein